MAYLKNGLNDLLYRVFVTDGDEVAAGLVAEAQINVDADLGVQFLPDPIFQLPHLMPVRVTVGQLHKAVVVGGRRRDHVNLPKHEVSFLKIGWLFLYIFYYYKFSLF